MPIPKFNTRDLFWTVTLFAIGLACVYASTKDGGWNTSWFFAALPALGAGLMAPIRKKRYGLAAGAMAGLGFWLLDNPDKSRNLFPWLESIIRFFVWQPVHIWGISAVLGVLFLAALLAKRRYPQTRCLPLFIATLAWLVYGFWEHKALVERMKIRVDLIFIWPIVFCVTAIAIAVLAQSGIRSRAEKAE